MRRGSTCLSPPLEKIEKTYKKFKTKKAKRKMSRADTIMEFDPKISMKLSKQDRDNLADLLKYESVKWFVEISKITSHGSFGELALINNDPRAANVEALTDCYFAVLGKADY